MQKQKNRRSEQNNYSNCPLPMIAPWGRFTPHTVFEKKNVILKIIILLLNNTYSLSTGPTVLISYNCDVLQNNKLWNTFFLTAENLTIYCEIRFLSGTSPV